MRRGSPGLIPADTDPGLKSRIESLTKSVDGLRSGLKFAAGKTEWKPETILQRNFKGIDLEVPNARAGDTVSVGSTQKLPDGVFLTATVNENGRVRVTAINMTDSDIPIDAGIIHVDVKGR